MGFAVAAAKLLRRTTCMKWLMFKNRTANVLFITDDFAIHCRSLGRDNHIDDVDSDKRVRRFRTKSDPGRTE